MEYVKFLIRKMRLAIDELESSHQYNGIDPKSSIEMLEKSVSEYKMLSEIEDIVKKYPSIKFDVIIK